MWASLTAQLVKNLPAMWATWVQSLGWKDALEKGKATHSSILFWPREFRELYPWDTTERLSLSCMGVRSCFRHVRLFATLWTVAHQTPLSTEFSWQEQWSGLPCPPPGDLSYPRIKRTSLTPPVLAGRFFTTDITWEAPISSAQFSHSVVSNSLRPHESQHARPPCPSPTPRVCSNSCPLSQWCHPAISSSVVPFSSCPQSLPASGSFPMSQLFESGDQSIGVSASASVLPMNTQNWSPLGWTGWISLQSKPAK